MEEVMNRTNADQKYLELAKEEKATYTFIIESEPEHGVTASFAIGYSVSDGKMTEVWVGEERKTDFTISGKYGVWVSILLGKLGLTKAFLTRKLRVRGDLMKIMKLSKATERWLEILRTLPTEFHGKYAEWNISGQ